MTCLTVVDDVLDVGVVLAGDVADGGEGKDADDDAGDCVDERHGHGVHQDLVAVAVVAGEGDDGAERDADRVEVLRHRVHPHLH